jgi:hypothetical protein
MKKLAPITSKGRGNSLLRAIWSPNVFHVERRTNLSDMGDKRINMHQRVVRCFKIPLYVNMTDATGGLMHYSYAPAHRALFY